MHAQSFYESINTIAEYMSMLFISREKQSKFFILIEVPIECHNRFGSRSRNSGNSADSLTSLDHYSNHLL